MGQKHNRVFWQRVIAAVEAGGAHAEVAARHGVSVGALRSWLYKLRKERGGAAASPTLRLLPVTMQAEAVAPSVGLDVEVGDYRLRFAPGTDPRYVAAVVHALAVK
jgi:transposase-like protein